MNYKKSFIDYCKYKKLEINESQIVIIESINNFYQKNFKNNFFYGLFSKKKRNKVFTYKVMLV